MGDIRGIAPGTRCVGRFSMQRYGFGGSACGDFEANGGDRYCLTPFIMFCDRRGRSGRQQQGFNNCRAKGFNGPGKMILIPGERSNWSDPHAPSEYTLKSEIQLLSPGSHRQNEKKRAPPRFFCAIGMSVATPLFPYPMRATMASSMGCVHWLWNIHASCCMSKGMMSGSRKCCLYRFSYFGPIFSA